MSTAGPSTGAGQPAPTRLTEGATARKGEAGTLSACSVLVTGAAGFFGLAITRALTREGAAVIAADQVSHESFSPRAGTRPEQVTYVRRNVSSDALEDLVAGADVIVHAAAVTPADGEEHEVAADLLETNLGALVRVLEAAGAGGSCGRVIFISSAAVYRQTRPRRLLEEDADGGDTLYGASKFAAEIVGRRYSESLGLEFCAVRPTALIGPGETERPSRPRVTPFASLLRAAQRGAPVSIRNAEARADWLSVDDAASAVAALAGAARIPNRAFNVSSGLTRPFSDVVAVIDSVVPLRVDEESQVVIDGGTDRPAEVVNEQIRKAIGWEPAGALEETVRAFLESIGEK